MPLSKEEIARKMEESYQMADDAIKVGQNPNIMLNRILRDYNHLLLDLFDTQERFTERDEILIRLEEQNRTLWERVDRINREVPGFDDEQIKMIIKENSELKRENLRLRDEGIRLGNERGKFKIDLENAEIKIGDLHREIKKRDKAIFELKQELIQDNRLVEEISRLRVRLVESEKREDEILRSILVGRDKPPKLVERRPFTEEEIKQMTEICQDKEEGVSKDKVNQDVSKVESKEVEVRKVKNVSWGDALVKTFNKPEVGESEVEKVEVVRTVENNSSLGAIPKVLPKGRGRGRGTPKVSEKVVGIQPVGVPPGCWYCGEKGHQHLGCPIREDDLKHKRPLRFYCHVCGTANKIVGDGHPCVRPQSA